jgi:hypothetical protein
MFKDQLISMRNYRPSYVEGTDNLRSSSFKDHACTEMHKKAMVLLKRQQSTNVVEYAPIAKAILGPKIDSVESERLRKKFDVAYVIAKESLAFSKMPVLVNMEERHGVDVGTKHKGDHACAEFVQFIAADLKEKLMSHVNSVKFFSVQCDASTDAGNVEEEMFIVLYFDSQLDSPDRKVRVRDRFLTVRHLVAGTGVGLFKCLERALDYMNVENWRSRLIGLGCDGTNANVADRGLKGHLQKDVPWAVVVWCLSHRLELALKDALKPTFFSCIDELLLQVYYLYENSPKKCKELDGVIEELKKCTEPEEMPKKGGNRPLRSCGTRFIAHKVLALNRIIDRFGAYLSHLTALSQDASVKSVDRQKLKGYVQKWNKFQVILGCAFFHDLLKPASILCKIFQEDELCVLHAIDAVVKTKTALEKLKVTPFLELPTVDRLMGRLKIDGDSVTYQQADLKRYKDGLSFVQNHYKEWTEAVESCLLSRLRSNPDELQLLSHTVTILATHGWERVDDTSFGHQPIEFIWERFEKPLEAAHVEHALLIEEWDDMVDFAKNFLNLVTEDYKQIWWKLYNSVDAKRWVNILTLVELLFCLPMANGHLERVFSQMKIVKTNRRTSLSEDTLDHILRIKCEGPPLES